MDASALAGLSSSCQAALPRLITSEFATCANLFGLVSLASSSGSIVPTLDTYIGGLCTTAPCAQSAITDADSIITQACATDIQSGSVIPTGIQLIIQNFYGIKSLLCTQQTSNSSYCVPEILYAAQNSTNTQFSLSTLTDLASNQNGTEALLSAIPTSVYCTDCGEAITIEAINLIETSNTSASGADSASTVRQAAGQQCGAGFANSTTLPATIKTVDDAANGTSTVSSANSNNSIGAARVGFSTKHAIVFGTIAATLASAMVAIV